MSELKAQSIFAFVAGTLSIRRSGYGDNNGGGWFAFEEEDVEFHPHDERNGNYCILRLDASEMAELRDFLNREIPVEAAEANARLIASGPATYAALVDLVQVFRARPDILALCGPHEHALIKAAFDALNKADGTPHEPRHTQAYCLAMRDMWQSMARESRWPPHVQDDCMRLAQQWKEAADATRE